MQSFSWLIEGVIAGSGLPGRLVIPSLGHTSHPLEKLENDFEFLRDRGIRSVLSLTEQPLDRTTVQAYGFEYLHVPVLDMTAPRIEDIHRSMAFIERSEIRTMPVLVHCAIGRGRTGAMLACYLVWKGSGATEAIRRVRSMRPGSIETMSQEEAVLEYESIRRTPHREKAGP